MGLPPLRRDRGYTLIEVMVVILVIGFALSLVAVRLSPKDQQRDHHVQLLLDFLQEAKERSIFSGSMVSVYCIWSSSQQWSCEQTMKDAGGERSAGKIYLPQGWSLVEPLGSVEGQVADNAPLRMHFLPGGEASSANITMHDADGNAWRFRLTETGGFSVEAF